MLLFQTRIIFFQRFALVALYYFHRSAHNLPFLRFSRKILIFLIMCCAVYAPLAHLYWLITTSTAKSHTLTITVPSRLPAALNVLTVVWRPLWHLTPPMLIFFIDNNSPMDNNTFSVLVVKVHLIFTFRNVKLTRPMPNFFAIIIIKRNRAVKPSLHVTTNRLSHPAT